jgi:hypothetical protein
MISDGYMDFVVEKLLRQQDINGTPHIEVQWKGYGLAEITWEPRTQLLLDVPDMVQASNNKKRKGRLPRLKAVESPATLTSS